MILFNNMPVLYGNETIDQLQKRKNATNLFFPFFMVQIITDILNSPKEEKM